MTKNTKLHRIKHDKTEIIFRTLTINEVCFLNNIKDEVTRQEYAAKLAITEPTDTSIIPWAIYIQVGLRAYQLSTKSIADKDIFEVTVKEYRQRIEEDTVSPMPLIGEILKVFPGQSITDLMNMTYEDLIEIAALCETMTGKQILNVGRPVSKRKGVKLVDPRSLPDDGKSLQRKMDELNAHLGIPK